MEGKKIKNRDKRINQNAEEVKNERFFRLDKAMFKFSAYVAFNKAINGQTDMKDEKEKKHGLVERWVGLHSNDPDTQLHLHIRLGPFHGFTRL